MRFCGNMKSVMNLMKKERKITNLVQFHPKKLIWTFNEVSFCRMVILNGLYSLILMQFRTQVHVLEQDLVSRKFFYGKISV